VSLLLDALRRAEQEKLARQGERDVPLAREAANAPIASAAPPAASLELQPLSAMPGPAPPRPDVAAMQAAKAVFQAKTPREEAAARGKGMIWFIIGAVLLVAGAASAYVWYSISALTPKPAPAPRVRPPPLPPSSSGSIPPASAPFSPIAPPATSLAPAPATPFAPAPVTPLAPAAATLAPEAAPPRKAAAATPRERLSSLIDESPAASPAPPLKLARSAEPPRIAADVAAGYEALRSGNLATARRSYQAALAADANNIDAHLGLATAQARLGDRAGASLSYRKALEIDPRNATALAGLAAIADFTRPDMLEMQLREDLSRYPRSSALHLALGNVYASQSRWREAQGEFFEAYRFDTESADIAFNLAVSMDHLGQAKLAAPYYTRALEASRGQSTQFDPAQVSRRLAEIAR
jgi:tetratricopeptide (TPR) repeat protein